MVYVIIAFLYAAIWLYLLMGGADFGAGIIELFSRHEGKKQTRQLTYQAIGPVWEANHMWLIIVIVILFVGYPIMYSVLSIHLHIPLVIMLLGIIARGTAFIFRHYDAVEDRLQSVYNHIFVYSSFITPLFLGIIAGSVIGGKIDTKADTFEAAYILPWYNWFSFAVGIFTVCICGFLAAIYLIGEASKMEEKQHFMKKARIFNLATVIAGLGVFFAAYYENEAFIAAFTGSMLSLTALLLASIALALLWYYLKKKHAILIRMLAGFQVTMILLAVGVIYFPDFIMLQNEANISLIESATNSNTINALGWSLLIGGLFILPSLGYLLYSFQKNPLDERREIIQH